MSTAAGLEEINSEVASTERGLVIGLGVAGVVASFVGIGVSVRVNTALRRIGDALDTSSRQVSSAAEQVATASQTLADGSSKQAAGLEDTNASLTEMSSMTARNTDNASQAKKLSAETRANAETGAQSMDAMSRAMQEIKQASGDIAKIVKTIDEIAFQTNILALNAAVESRLNNSFVKKRVASLGWKNRLLHRPLGLRQALRDHLLGCGFLTAALKRPICTSSRCAHAPPADDQPRRHRSSDSRALISLVVGDEQKKYGWANIRIDSDAEADVTLTRKDGYLKKHGSV